MRVRFPELRPLRLPFWITLILAAALPVLRAIEGPFAGESWSFLLGLLQFTFLAGILLLAVLPFGLEFQCRTFPLLLAQPKSRWRTWRERMGVACAAIALCAIVQAFSQITLMLFSARLFDAGLTQQFWWSDHGFAPTRFALRYFFSKDTLVVHGFILVTACSAAFWTLNTGSVIAGIVFTFAGEVLATTLVYFAVGQFTANEDVFPIAVAIAGLIYCLLLLWAGWRTFARMQVKGAVFGEAAGTGDGLAGISWQPRFLFSTRSHKWRNLIRKEVRLQKPVFMLTVVFIAVWTFIRLLARFQPARHEMYEIILSILTTAYVPVVALLAGAGSLSDEKSLGINSWHLTLPIALSRQWLMKLLVAISLTLCCAAIPYLMYWILPPPQALFSRDPHSYYGDQFWTFVGAFSGVMVITLVSFWAATFTEGIVRAVITTLVTIAALGASAALGVWSADQFRDQLGGLQTSVLGFLLSIFGSAPEMARHPILRHGAVAALVALLLCAFLIRSFAQFRCIQVPRRNLIVWFAALLLLACVGGFWCADFILSASEIGGNPR